MMNSTARFLILGWPNF
uniref:Uncharacterized protein n=1 Tax=Arundo donax TaxID=35708 RepID=A0A0A9FDK5_ARUDO